SSYHRERNQSFPWESYMRNSSFYTLGNLGYELQSLHGVGDFDSPHILLSCMAKLTEKLSRLLIPRLASASPTAKILFFEPEQGHFVRFFLEFLAKEGLSKIPEVTLSGRNILALEASRHNLPSHIPCTVIPAVDPALMGDAKTYEDGKGFHELRQPAPQRFDCVFFVPDIVPKTDRWSAYWGALHSLLADEGLVFVALGATDGERFDKMKPKGFIRLGDIKRQGFRVLAYQNRVSLGSHQLA
ncbi:MAG: hypothetical protein SNJ56_05930, partial [Termitinemataceae bacterium]